MNRTRRWHRFLSLIVSLSLLLQSIAPAWAMSSPALAAAGSETAVSDSITVLSTPAQEEEAVLPATAMLFSALDSPVSISRVQSAYTTGSSMVITFTITNNLPPTQIPIVPAEAADDDYPAILAGMDVADDVNTLHDVTLSSTLVHGTFVSAGGTYTRNGDTIVWQTPPIPPQASAAITLAVTAPTTAADFVLLDTGAQATATRWGESVTATAHPITVIPASVEAVFTQPTVDADLYDTDMLWWSAGLNQNPEAIFAAVKAFAYDPYKGSLRGTRGTLWGAAGNAVDQSSLLIAALRSAGIPARYRHGALSAATARSLLATTFPPTQGMAGYVPADAATADPINDDALLALVQDHWWVEAYLPGRGWTDLDPSFPNAAIGENLAASTAANDRSAALPDALRHQVTLRLEVEQYSQFPIGGANLRRFVPLTATYATVQLAAKSLALGHFVDSVLPPGMIFGAVMHTYTPYFAVDGDGFLTTGDEFQDVMTTFPLASVFTTAQWITVETSDADGNVETFTREVKDLIGLGNRMGGPIPDLRMDGQPFTSFDDAFALWFLPNQVQMTDFAVRQRTAATYDLLDYAAAIVALPADTSTPAGSAALREVTFDYFLARNRQYALAGLVFAELADPAVRDIEHSLRVKLFYTQPRIIITSSSVSVEGKIRAMVDLRSTQAEAIVYPGQAQAAAATAQWIKAVAESYFEGAAVWRIVEREPLIVASIFDALADQSVAPMLVTADKAHLLDLYLPDPNEYAYAVQALVEGRSVLIPQAPVTVAGQPTLGWWEVDPDSGRVTSVLSQGVNGALIEYDMLVNILDAAVTLYGAAGMQKSVSDLWSCVVRSVVPALQGNPGGSGSCVGGTFGPPWDPGTAGWGPPGPEPPWVPPISWFAARSAAAQEATASWRYLPAHRCPVDNCGVEQFVLPYPDQQPIPLPNVAFGYNDRFGGEDQAARTLTVANDGSGGAPRLTLGTAPNAGTVLPGAVHRFDLTSSANFDGLVDVWAYAPAGWQIRFDAATLQAEVAAQPGVLPGDYIIQLVAQSQADPSVIATAQHVVTIPSPNTLTLIWQPEPNITVPMGAAQLAAVSNQTNDGAPEIPNAAFRLGVANNSGIEKVLTLTVSGAPAGWVVLNGRRQESATFTLGANQRTQPGLYIAPPTLPAPGTSFTLNVQVSGGGSNASVSIPWSMSGQAHSFLQMNPTTLYVAENGSVDFEVTLTNVGNSGGSFAIAPTIALSTATFSNLQTPVSLAPGQSSSRVATLSVANAERGRRYPLQLASPAPGGYTQYALAEVQIVSAVSGAILDAANACALTPSLDAALESLALAVVELEYWCDEGDCPLPLRDRVIAAAESVIDYAGSAARPIDLLSLAGVRSAVDNLRSQSNDVGILAGLTDLGASITVLSGELCQATQHRPGARFAPYIDAVLLGETANFSLNVTNQGSIATTYAVTVTGLPGGAVQQNVTINPGATTSLPLATTPSALGVYDLAATVTPLTQGLTLDMTARATARLNVVDRFVQVTQVSPDPAFVETGASSTNVAATVANLAGVAQPATARMVIAGAGGVLRFNNETPITVLAGNPRSYPLATVDTSGWAAGVYTVSVHLVDGAGAPIPDGAGYGYLNVGQGLEIEHAVTPVLVAPGTVDVTTVITTTLAGVTGSQTNTNLYAPAPVVRRATSAPAAASAPLASAADGVPSAVLGVMSAPAAASSVQGSAGALYLPLLTNGAGEAAEATGAQPIAAIQPRTNGPAFTRIEQNDAAFTYTGTWADVTLAAASGGSHRRNNIAGSTAQLSFSGAWVIVGFVGYFRGGYAEIFIDGASRGVVDLYRNLETPISFRYGGLSNGAHTLEIRVLGSGNPFSSQFHVQLDYVDYGDGSALPDGAFEQDDSRVRLSGGWSSTTYAGASGGSYASSTVGAAWFPFTGDSFSLQALAHRSAGMAQLFVDGRYLDTIDLFAPVFATAGVTRTFAYAGLGAGPHVLQVTAYQYATAIDRFDAPGQAPFINPNPPVSGVTRFEADHPSIRYNGAPFTQTASSWVRVASIAANRASASEYIFSATANDAISFAFAGSWLGIGFVTDRFGGQAAIAIDGQPVQTVDLYTREEDTTSVYLSGLGAGQHTVTITVLGASHPNASAARVHLDFFDVWDGQPLPQGTFEEESDRLFTSSGWGRTLDANASGGAYATSGNANSTIWFPFTGDSVTFRTWAQLSQKQLEVRIDGVSQGLFDTYAYEDATRLFNFTGLGSGPHVLEVRRYRETAIVDAFHVPALGPAVLPPPASPIMRYEENHADMRYNGYPHRTMAQSWFNQGNNWPASGSYNVSASTPGNRWRFEFEGVWVNLGFQSPNDGGAAEVFIDGVSRGIVQTAGGVNGVVNFPFGNLAPGAHTVETVIISGTVRPDYIDVWDGRPLADGWYDADLEDRSGRFHFSNRTWWRMAENQYAWEGDYLTNFASSSNNIWFTFVGADLTILGFQRANTTLHVVIDGVYKGVFDMTPQFAEQPFALHFPGLGEGAHVVQVFLPSLGGTVARIDAFHVNPPNFYDHTPKVQWYDFTAQESLTGTTNTGFATTIAIGDLNGDGVVELVAPGTNGRLYVYRGDGQNTGNGTPILWTSDLVGPAAEPALADLNDDGTAEIIVSGKNGTFAFTHAGAVLWHNPSVVSYYPNEDFGWGGPTVGNLDLDPAPEIVIASSDVGLYVLDHQGVIQFSDPTLGRWPTVPVLADITGDGILDIIVAQGWELRVYDFFNGGQLVWSRTLPDPINILGGGGAFGSPAVADLTGDGRPEIIINWGHVVEALRDDGTVLWRYLTNSISLFRPSPITVADVTGDGQMNVVTASALQSGFNIFNHLLMVIDANGALVWDQLVADNTASASGVAAQDLTGNGVWEILWNGATDGFLVIRGSDGKRLFNEPVTGSGTVLDYPTLGDVDGDGYAEVVVSGRQGIFVIGHDGVWADSRPLWNQHNYHITNINDDWSTPIDEPDSWTTHNTYRTQTPDRTPAPSYQLAFTYTAGAPAVTVLTETASISLTAAPPHYTWSYRQELNQPVIAASFVSRLTGLQPGETRQVSAGMVAAYRLPGGYNFLTLPPLYVTAARLGELTPASAAVAIGGSARFTVTLTNPSAVADTYALAVRGVPAAWVNMPANVALPAGATVTVPVTVTVPPDATADILPLLIDVTNGSGSVERLQATVNVFAGVTLAITPFSQTTRPGAPVTYTLAITNHESVARTYALAARGALAFGIPASVQVAPGERVELAVTVGSMAAGAQPFSIGASTADGISASADAVLDVEATTRAALSLVPNPLVAGLGSTGVFTLSVVNLGDAVETFDLTVDLPSGWAYALQRNGESVERVTLPPFVFNRIDLVLLVTPPTTAAAGNYPVMAQASTTDGIVAGATAATVQLLERGVQVSFVGGPASVPPRNGGVWEVRVTNSGRVADTFNLQAAGFGASAASFSTARVSLAAGASQVVQLRIGDLSPMTPQSGLLGVIATSQTQPAIRSQATTPVGVDVSAAVAAAWEPGNQTLATGETAHLFLAITNRGNVAERYRIAITAGDAAVSGAPDELSLPPGFTARTPVTVYAAQPGSYNITARIDADSGVSASDSATIIFEGETQQTLTTIFLPIALRGGAQLSGEAPALAAWVFLPLAVNGSSVIVADDKDDTTAVESPPPDDLQVIDDPEASPVEPPQESLPDAEEFADTPVIAPPDEPAAPAEDVQIAPPVEADSTATE